MIVYGGISRSPEGEAHEDGTHYIKSSEEDGQLQYLSVSVAIDEHG